MTDDLKKIFNGTESTNELTTSQRKPRRRRKSRETVQRVSAYLTVEEYNILSELADFYDEALTKTLSRSIFALYEKTKNSKHSAAQNYERY